MRDSAVTKALASGALADLEIAASVVKTVSDEKKISLESTASDRTYRLSKLQLWLTSATIIISVAGFISTTIFSVVQMAAATAQVDTTEWRELLTDVGKASSSKDFANSVTIPYRLRSFASSSRYSHDARLLATAIISRVSDTVGFQQLYQFIFPEDEVIDIAAVLDISRELNVRSLADSDSCFGQRYRVTSMPAELANPCWSGISDAQLISWGVTNDDVIWTLRKDMVTVFSEQRFLSQKIALVMHDTNKTKNASLKGTYLTWADMSGVNFDGVDLSNANFDAVNLTRAHLAPSKFDRVSFAGTNWWDAAYIEPHFLQYLISNAFLNRNDRFFYSGRRPSLAEYTNAVMTLCAQDSTPCEASAIKFEPLAASN
jgi:hypothetical protein